MTMLEFFTNLKKQGIGLQVVDGNLKINAPKSKLTPDIIAQLRENKAEIVAFLQKHVHKKEQYTAIEPAEVKEYYVLSSAQRRLFILQQMEPAETGYNMPAVMTLEGDLDRERLETTFCLLIERHESLRTSFKLLHGEPVQQIIAPRDALFKLDTYDGTHDEASIKNIVGQFIRAFDLADAPLFRAGLVQRRDAVDSYVLMVDMHHIISDGTSLDIVIREFMALYGGQSLPAPTVQYKDYSEWQQNGKGREELQRQEAFWTGQFEGEIPVLDIPTDFVRPAVQVFEGSTTRFHIESELTGMLHQLAAKEGVTLFMLMLAIYNIFLARLSGQDDIVTGSPVAGRSHEDLRSIVGMFVNTLALRNSPSGNLTFPAFLHDLKQKTLAAFDHQDYQYEDLVEKVDVQRNAARNPLFDTMFILQNIDIPELRIPGLVLKPFEYQRNTAKFDLTLEITQQNDRLSCLFEYGSRLFKPQTIERFARFFKQLVSAVAAGPERQISDYRLLGEEDRAELRDFFNGENIDFSIQDTLHGLFRRRAQDHPERIAVRLPGQGDGKEYGVTYGELDKETGALAQQLVARGITTGSLAALLVTPGVHMLTAILATLKAGAAYVPIDPNYPAERVSYILRDCSARILLTGGNDEPPGLDRIDIDIDIVDVERARTEYPGPSAVSPSQPGEPGDLAYIIYTSGSTGKPKGVPVQHCAVLNTLYSLQYAYPFSPQDVYLLKTSYTFDVSVSEIFGWFIGGGSVATIDDQARKDPARIVEAVGMYRVTHINFVPSLFNVLVDILTAEQARTLECLKYIFLAGEALLPEMVKKFRALNTNIELHNIYGPTEASIYASWYDVKDFKEDTPVPIGRPLPNVGLYIFDKQNALQPVGVPGELCIGGAGLAMGYLNRPELTAERFFNHEGKEGKEEKEARSSWLVARREKNIKAPNKEGKEGKEARSSWLVARREKNIEAPSFAPPSSYELRATSYPPSLLLYRTGDLCRWLPGGNIEFLGRIDHQVKIRGFRIELGEIESRLAAHPRIKETVVTSGVHKSGENYLCAYYVSGGQLELPGILDYLGQHLPEYMIPAYFMELQELPLTPSGKINRRALPKPVVKSGKRFVAPGNDNERIIADTWKELLDIDQVGVDDNFFEIGGSSLAAVKLSHALKEKFQKDIPVVTVFRSPTVRALAAYLEKQDESFNKRRTEVFKAIDKGKDKKKQRLERRRKPAPRPAPGRR